MKKTPTFCFTSDFDGATPQEVRTIYEIYYANRVPATIFLGFGDVNYKSIWHDPAKGRSLHHEVGLHPNFLNTADYSFTIGKLKKVYTSIRGVRSHGLMVFSNLLDMYERAGLLYDSSYLMHNVISEPFMIRNALVELPIFFEDDVQMALGKPLGIEYLYFHDGVHVFNFHPKHVHENDLIKFLLKDIIKYARRNHYKITTCREVAEKVLSRDSRMETKVMR